jgi:hypothetical protein
MMEAASSSETSVNFYQTTRRSNPEDSHLQSSQNLEPVSGCKDDGFARDIFVADRTVTTKYFVWFLTVICIHLVITD